MNRVKLHREFRKQVEREDYAEREVDGIMSWLEVVTKKQ